MFRLLIILLLWSLNSCKGQSESKESFITDEPEVVNNIALDKLLKCDMYDIREGHYRIPDYGCVVGSPYLVQFKNTNLDII